MKFISDDRIHLFIINPILLDENEIELINDNIAKNAGFRAYISNLKSFYAELAEEQISNVIELYPERFISDNEIRLVAQQEKVKSNMKYVGFHASASKIVFTRIFRDYSTGEYQLHLVAEEGVKRTMYGVIEIKEMNKYLFADETGVIKSKDDISFEKHVLNLIPPAGVFNLKKSNVTNETEIITLLSDSKVKIEIENDVIKIIPNKSNLNRSIKVFINETETKTSQLDTDDGIRFRFPKNIKFPSRLTIIEI